MWAIAGPDYLQVIPSGLEFLLSVDQLVIKQKVQFFEGNTSLTSVRVSNKVLAVTGFEQQNRYKVENSAGQILYEALEGIVTYEWITSSLLCPRQWAESVIAFVATECDLSTWKLWTIKNNKCFIWDVPSDAIRVSFSAVFRCVFIFAVNVE